MIFFMCGFLTYTSLTRFFFRRKIFKVETVGDCYVAVAGLPKPLPSHAAAMSRFAKDILQAFQEVMWKLQVTLGPDTGKHIDFAIDLGLTLTFSNRNVNHIFSGLVSSCRNP